MEILGWGGRVGGFPSPGACAVFSQYMGVKIHAESSEHEGVPIAAELDPDDAKGGTNDQHEPPAHAPIVKPAAFALPAAQGLSVNEVARPVFGGRDPGSSSCTVGFFPPALGAAIASTSVRPSGAATLSVTRVEVHGAPSAGRATALIRTGVGTASAFAAMHPAALDGEGHTVARKS